MLLYGKSENERASNRFGPWLLAIGLAFAVALVPRAAAADDVKIVENGLPLAVIVVADQSDERTRDAAHRLAEYVEKSTGAELPVAAESEVAGSPGTVSIYVGFAGEDGDPSIAATLPGLDDDGFIIAPYGDSVTIIGPTSWGTGFGVDAFLERYLGVSWLMPGPDGEDVPEHTDVSVPAETIIEEPVFPSRHIFKLDNPNIPEPGQHQFAVDWAERNRLHSRIVGYSHNLWSLFPSSLYGQSNPEFYPLRDGQRFIPPANVRSGWQPCLTIDGTVQAAVYGIKAYFAANPEREAISLAVNDLGGFCEAQPDEPYNLTHPDSPYNQNRLNSYGRLDLSDIYYHWVNRVVAEVRQEYPDKWFGVLAYREVVDPPSFPLNDHVIPYITKDRMAWVDEDVREAEQQRMEAWHDKAANIGYYDYSYGNPYVLPRIYNKQMADTYRYAAENGVIAHAEEMSPNWAGEAPKNWLKTRLLWDPFQDEDELLDQWYERMVGPAAAPDLKAYFDYWEQFWTERVQHSSWFQGRKDIVYFNYQSATYLHLVTDEDMAYSRQWLESALAKAVTDKQKARARLLLRAFEYYEASALSYPRMAAKPTNNSEALELLTDAFFSVETGVPMAKRRMELIDEYSSEPVLRHYLDPVDLKMVWSGYNSSAFWNLVEYMLQNQDICGPVREQIADRANDATPSPAREFARLLLHASGAKPPVNENSSFEEGFGVAASWHENISRFGTFERVEGQTRLTGDASLFVGHFYYGDLLQVIPVKSGSLQPGLFAAHLGLYVSTDSLSIGDIWISVKLLDREGATLHTFKSEAIKFAASKGKWSNLQLMDEIPATVANANGVQTEVAQVELSATVNGFFEQGTLYLDDFEIFQ